MAIKVKGVKRLRSNLNKAFDNVASGVTERGIYSGLILLSGYSTIAVPVDTANLANSQFIYFPKRVGDKVIGSIQYTANYAEVVHDGGEKNWQKTGARAEYLSGPAEENKSEIWDTIKEDSKI
ncbi:MAG: hypothetical protein KTR16_11600 [Acidiferrobacterales bacterium]|nr:hypothetical protein [Acidiferrobacterales bacterium]